MCYILPKIQSYCQHIFSRAVNLDIEQPFVIHTDPAKALDYPKIIFFVDEHNPHKVCYKCYKGCHVHETRTMGEHKNEL